MTLHTFKKASSRVSIHGPKGPCSVCGVSADTRLFSGWEQREKWKRTQRATIIPTLAPSQPAALKGRKPTPRRVRDQMDPYFLDYLDFAGRLFLCPWGFLSHLRGTGDRFLRAPAFALPATGKCNHSSPVVWAITSSGAAGGTQTSQTGCWPAAGSRSALAPKRSSPARDYPSRLRRIPPLVL